MTRDQDVFVALDERVRVTRAAKADLFISIHAESISAAPHVRGGRSIPARSAPPTPKSANLAERENKADAVAGLDSRDTANDVAEHPSGADAGGRAALSHRFAKKLLGKLDPVMRLSKKPHREAGFKVLRAPDVPSVLVELGYLSSSAISTSSPPTPGATARPPRWRRRSTSISARGVAKQGPSDPRGAPEFTIDAVSKERVDNDGGRLEFLR